MLQDAAVQVEKCFEASVRCALYLQTISPDDNKCALCLPHSRLNVANGPYGGEPALTGRYRPIAVEEVWTDAMTVVAPRYGLSDVGLVKICTKLGIPVPPRGYWAKVKAGRPTRKTPLPALPDRARYFVGPIRLSEHEAATPARVHDAIQQTLENQSPSWQSRRIAGHPSHERASTRSTRTVD